MLFADDAVPPTHTEEDLQKLMDIFSYACKEFGLTMCNKESNVMG